VSQIITDLVPEIDPKAQRIGGGTVKNYSVYRISTGLVEAMRKPCGSLMSAPKLFEDSLLK
jgi:hypothetical protein